MRRRMRRSRPVEIPLDAARRQAWCDEIDAAIDSGDQGRLLRAQSAIGNPVDATWPVGVEPHLRPASVEEAPANIEDEPEPNFSIGWID